MRLIGPLNTGVAAGGAGAATSTATTTNLVIGLVMGIYVRYNHTPPAATTDVVVTTAGSNSAIPAQTLLTLTDSATDGLYRPRVIGDDLVGVTLIADAAAEPIAIYDQVKVTISQANNSDSVDIWLLMED